MSNYTLMKTGDGSYTVHDSVFDETMHSVSGAYEEALLKHVYPSRIIQMNEPILNVLDIGFGLGYNVLALVIELQKHRFSGTLNIISCEKMKTYTDLLESIVFFDERDRIYSVIKKAYATGSSHADNYHLSVHFGDARDIVDGLSDSSFHAVFLDPYSPSKNPELWSVEFFRKLYYVMHHKAILTTYSSAVQIRVAMLDAGFVIGRGPSVGKKKEGTIASKSNEVAAFSEEEINVIRSTKGAIPYRDLTLKGSREEILTIRRMEMKRYSISSSSSNSDLSSV